MKIGVKRQPIIIIDIWLKKMAKLGLMKMKKLRQPQIKI